LKRIALGLEYDGAHFAGWQTQPDGSGIQDAVQAALLSFAGHRLPVVCAGRTDAGVHATGQVIHLDTSLERDLVSWVRGVNRFLPAAVSVRWARPVPADFHARFSALRRTYEYWILNDAVRSPLHERRAAWVYRPLDEAAMQTAALALVGRHDFSSFRSAQCQAASAVRELYAFEVIRLGRMVRIRVVANAFLHHMVRNLVGTFILVGKKTLQVEDVTRILEARDRSAAGATAPASGLYLVHLAGMPLTMSWIAWSLALFALAGACWLPVVWIQIRMAAMAERAAADGTALPPLFWRYHRIWTALGFPAFFAFIAIFYLMVAKPA